MRLPKRCKRQSLEHDVGDAAVGRRVAGAFARLDQAVGRLSLAAGVARRCVRVDRSSSWPSAQTRPMPVISPSATATAKLAK